MAQYHGTSRANISEAMGVAKQLIITLVNFETFRN